MIEFHCGNCGHLIAVKNSAAGQHRRCGKCKATQLVPAAPSGSQTQRPPKEPKGAAAPRGAVSSVRAYWPLIALGVGLAVVVPVGVWGVRTALRDTWEEDHVGQVRDMEARAFRLTEKQKPEEALKLHRKIVDLLDDRELENEKLKYALRHSRRAIRRLEGSLAEEYLRRNRAKIDENVARAERLLDAGQHEQAKEALSAAVTLLDEAPHIEGRLKARRRELAERIERITKRVRTARELLGKIEQACKAVREHEKRQHAVVRYMARADPFFDRLRRLRETVEGGPELAQYASGVSALKETKGRVGKPPDHSQAAERIASNVDTLVEDHTEALDHWRAARDSTRRAQLLELRDDCWRYAQADGKRLLDAWGDLQRSHARQSVVLFSGKLVLLQWRLKAAELLAEGLLGRRQYESILGPSQCEAIVSDLAGDLRQMQAVTPAASPVPPQVYQQVLGRARKVQQKCRDVLEDPAIHRAADTGLLETLRDRLAQLRQDCADFQSYWAEVSSSD